MHPKLGWLLLALLAAWGVDGFFREGLLAEQLWRPEGVTRFFAYTSGCALIGGAIVWRWPRQIAWVAAAAMLAWAVWWTGPGAVIAVLCFLASCAALGHLPGTRAAEAGVAAGNRPDDVCALLAGAAVWIWVLWAALHLPVNVPWAYGLAFLIPMLALAIIASRRGVWRSGGIVAQIELSLPRPQSRAEAAACLVLLWVLGTHFLAALKPEISADGVSMHLALPAHVATHGFWPFDHRFATWSLMPSGGDALYTGVYLLGGEMAAKLLNFAFLVLLCAALFRIAIRWTSLAKAYLIVALFASTPLVELVTASLFVENIWAALIVGALLLLMDQRPVAAALLAGAAVSVKLIAVAFAAPVCLAILLQVLRNRTAQASLARLAAAAAVFVFFAAPPYAFAYARSGNPIFPFANDVFRSPDYDAERPFVDTRYADLRPSITTLYDMTFRSEIWVEGQGGASGFHYFVLLLPSLLLLRRGSRGCEQLLTVFVAATATAIVLLGAPNLRYLYPALPLATVAIAWTPWTVLAVPLITANLWFLPAASYYDAEFALFDHSAIEPYLTAKAPVRLLIERLNREAPGEPVAFFSTDAIAGLQGPAYTATWHNEAWWKSVRNAPDAAAIAAIFRDRGIRHVVAPANGTAPFEVVQKFFDGWLDRVEGSETGVLALYRLRDEERLPPKDTRPLTPLPDGSPSRYEDTEPRIEYTGAWLHDDQFAAASGHSISYSDQAGDRLSFTFEGKAITYVYTRALNRGIAEIWIDGRLVRRLNQYSAEIAWQQSTRFAVSSAGPHTMVIRVGGRKDAKSQGSYVDLDAIEVE